MGKVHCSLESVKILVQFHKRFKMADFGKMQFGDMFFWFDIRER